ncbi:hypothetical protein P9112_002557 [Eukaryota sp. TZLM1-RC]
MSITFSLNKQPHSCIEFPGRVLNSGRAVSFLGGYGSLTKAITEKAPLKLFFKETTSCPVPIQGKVNSSCSFLLNIDSSQSSISAHCTGTITQTFSFPNIADHQVLVPETPLQTLAETDDEPPIDDIFFPVSKFSRYTDVYHPSWNSILKSVPGAFSLINDTSEVVDEQNENVTQVVSPPQSSFLPVSTINVSFEDLVNGKVPEVTEAPQRLQSIGVYDNVSQLLNESPVWIRSRLMARLEANSVNQCRQVIAHLFYSVKNGPWRRCLCKKGLNLALDPQMRKFQTIDIRDLNSAQLDYLTRQHSQPKSITTQKCLIVMLCELPIPQVQELLNESPADICTLKYGWIKKEIYEKIQKIVNIEIDKFDDSQANSTRLSSLMTIRGLPIKETEEEEMQQ